MVYMSKRLTVVISRWWDFFFCFSVLLEYILEWAPIIFNVWNDKDVLSKRLNKNENLSVFCLSHVPHPNNPKVVFNFQLNMTTKKCRDLPNINERKNHYIHYIQWLKIFGLVYQEKPSVSRLLFFQYILPYHQIFFFPTQLLSFFSFAFNNLFLNYSWNTILVLGIQHGD